METVPPPFPAPTIEFGGRRGKPIIIRPPEVSAAHDFAVVGYILTLILTVPWFIIVATVGALGVTAYLGYLVLPPALPVSISGIPFVGTFIAFLTYVLTPSFIVYLGLGGGGLLVLLIFLAILYSSTVRSLNKGRYEKARNASLFFGVLFLLPSFFILVSPALSGMIAAVLPAFFFLLTYGRLGEVIAKYGPVAILGEAVPGMPMISGPAPGPMPAPVPGDVQVAAPPQQVPPGFQPLTGVAPRVPLCPGCGRELYYSANHRRWYCMACDNPAAHR